MSSIFGFSDSLKEMERFARNAGQSPKVVDEYANKMADEAKKILASKGLVKTGKAASGIQVENKGDDRDIGWGARPNFHGYFHEIGFHALDNRKKVQRLKREGKARIRSYRGVKATYVRPSPHMRPAFDKHESAFYRDMQKKLEQ